MNLNTDNQENHIFFFYNYYTGNLLNALNGLFYIAYLLSFIVKRSKYFGCAGAVKQKWKMEKMY